MVASIIYIPAYAKALPREGAISSCVALPAVFLASSTRLHAMLAGNQNE